MKEMASDLTSGPSQFPVFARETTGLIEQKPWNDTVSNETARSQHTH